MAHEKLTARERKFVENRLSGMKRGDAAVAAGYAVAGAGVRASELVKKPKVMAALLEGSKRKLSDGAVSAVDTLTELMDYAASESVRLEAARTLLAHGGLAAIKQHEHKHVIQDDRPLAELKAHAQMLYARLGLDRNSPLPPIVDVDAEPVALPAPAHDPFADA